MKKRYSFALLAIATCLTLQQDIAANSAKEMAKILKKVPTEELRILLHKLDAAEKLYEDTTKALYTEFLNKSPQGTSNRSFVKAGISRLLAALAAGYCLGMNHKTIENTFEEQIRPAITLSSENLPTKKEAGVLAHKFAHQSLEYLKRTLKDVALKNPEQEKPETEKKSDKDNQNS